MINDDGSGFNMGYSAVLKKNGGEVREKRISGKISLFVGKVLPSSCNI